MKKVHVLCAFYRQYLLQTLVHYLEPMEIDWIPACDDIDIKPFETFKRDWIHPVLCPKLRIPGDQVYKKFNDCVDRMEIVDDDYYCFMGDDDMYEPGFFDEIKNQTAKIIVFSATRGNSLPTNRAVVLHPPTPLIIRSLGDMRAGNINLQQYVVSGEILKQIRFDGTSGYGDGYFAEELAKRFGSEIKIMPDLFAFNNYFEPGRYTNNGWKIKPNWELPTIIDEEANVNSI